MAHRLLATAAVLAAGVGATVLAARRGLERWDATPPPRSDLPPRFPAGTEHTVPTDDGAALRVVDAGHGPTVVLVHGLVSNTDDLGWIAERLVASGHRVIGVNQRGHGGSTVGTEGFSAARYGRDVARVLERLDIRDAVVAGHSMGGIATMSLAVGHPDVMAARVRGLVLIATIARTTRADQRAMLRLMSVPRPDAMAHDAPAARVITRWLFGTEVSGAFIDAAIESGYRCPPDTRTHAALGLADYDIREGLTTLDVPTAVICGTRDLLTPIIENRAIARRIPGAEMVEVPGSGHIIIWEHDDVIAEHIARLAAPVEVPAG